MNKFTATFASIAATLLLAGNAMAQMPAAGEGPFVEHQDYAAKRAQKTEVTRAPVSIKQVAVGEMNGIAKQTNDVNSPSRAEVRQETRDAISAGHGPATGAGVKFRDVDASEVVTLLPLIVLMFALGLVPQLLAGLVNPLVTTWATTLP